MDDLNVMVTQFSNLPTLSTAATKTTLFPIDTTPPNDKKNKTKQNNTGRTKTIPKAHVRDTNIPALPLMQIFSLLDVTSSAIKARLDMIYRDCVVCHDVNVPRDSVLSLDERMKLCQLTPIDEPQTRVCGKQKMHAYMEYMGQVLKVSRTQSINFKNWQLKNAKKLMKPDQLKDQQSAFRKLRSDIRSQLGMRQNVSKIHKRNTKAAAATTTTTTTSSSVISFGHAVTSITEDEEAEEDDVICDNEM